MAPSQRTDDQRAAGLTPAGRPREWSPHIWNGCDLPAWLKLLARNRFQVSGSLYYVIGGVTFVSMVNTMLGLVERAFCGWRIARTPVKRSPLFIIGHWRTGTTLLHELLILDERHTYPTTYECLAPHHFLVSEWIADRFLSWMMTRRRPMDNMATGWDRPQEDEFALCMLGVPSPYWTVAFPNHPPQFPEYLDLEDLSQKDLDAWKQAFLGFLQRLTVRDKRRLVLKSPPHTCRIKVLLELFPDARFVHIVRDPYVVFPSTVHLWKSLYQAHGLQKPTFEGLEEHVFRTFLRVYDKLEEGRKLVEPSHFYEMRYEELVADPLGQMEALYDHFHMGGFDAVKPRMADYFARNTGYETNRFRLTAERRDEIAHRWGEVIRRYGYGEPEPTLLVCPGRTSGI